MRHIGRHYVQTFNFKYARTGPLFEGRFKSTLVQSADYLMQCVRKRIKLWTPHKEYLALGNTKRDRAAQYRFLVSQSLSAEVVQKIRHCVSTGLVLGTEGFREQVRALRR